LLAITSHWQLLDLLTAKVFARCENETGQFIVRPRGWQIGSGSRTFAIATTLPMTIRVGEASQQVSMG
jgi:hypothetical protein